MTRSRIFSVATAVAMVLATVVVGSSTAGAAPVTVEEPGWLRVVSSPAVGSQISVDGDWSNT